MFKDTITMYIWGTPVTMTLEVYYWIMRGSTRKNRLKRAVMLFNKRKSEGRYF